MLLTGCFTKPPVVIDDEYWDEEVRISPGPNGDTTFWRCKQLGFLLTQNEGDVWVVIKMEKHYDRYSLWKVVGCDSVNKCLKYESQVFNEKYYLLGQKTEWVFQYGEKYVYEVDQ